MPVYKLLEEKYAKFVGSKYAVSCNSGTAALHLALLAINISKGDEVIIPDFTMAACGFAVSYCGATPVFVDCDDTLCMDWTLIESKITKKTKAIMAVHIYGRLCNMKEILRIAKKHKLKVIEDACEAQGAVYKSKADITCYSFYANKIIHAEEGGICTTDSKYYAARMNYLKNMAFGEDHNYYHAEIGYNYRMPNSQAKLALVSLNLCDINIKSRNRKIKTLDKYLDVTKLPKRDAPWVYDYLGPVFEVFQNETRLFFKPLSSFPMYGGKCQSPKAQYYSERGRYIKL
jgi:dTDP-4-amino-4,6-dideoxygalactose transaminase